MEKQLVLGWAQAAPLKCWSQNSAVMAAELSLMAAVHAAGSAGSQARPSSSPGVGEPESSGRGFSVGLAPPGLRPPTALKEDGGLLSRHIPAEVAVLCAMQSPNFPCGPLGKQAKGAQPASALKCGMFQKALCAAAVAGPGQACSSEMQALLHRWQPPSL